jgi:hypothetical protein
MKTCAHLIEFTFNVEILEDEWNNHLMQQLLEKATKSFVLVNNWFSFQKEVIEYHGNFERCRNLIALYVNLENLTLQESVDELHKQILEADKEILEVVQSLKK